MWLVEEHQCAPVVHLKILHDPWKDRKLYFYGLERRKKVVKPKLCLDRDRHPNVNAIFTFFSFSYFFHSMNYEFMTAVKMVLCRFCGEITD